MAEISYNSLIDRVSGAMSKGGAIHRQKHYTMNGHTIAGKKEVFFRKSRDWDKIPAREGEVQNQSRFAEASRLSKEELNDPIRRVYWEERFVKQLRKKEAGNKKIYKKFDAFVKAMIIQGMGKALM